MKAKIYPIAREQFDQYTEGATFDRLSAKNLEAEYAVVSIDGIDVTFNRSLLGGECYAIVSENNGSNKVHELFQKRK